MQNNKTVLISVVILLLLVIGVAYFLFTRGSSDDVIVEDESGFTSVSGDERNSIIVNDQIPGNTVFFQNLTLEENGFVVVRSETNDEPGEVVGSLYVEAGADQTGNVELNLPTTEGGVYYVELYLDSDANGEFDETLDSPVRTAGGSAVRVQIETTEDLPEIKG